MKTPCFSLGNIFLLMLLVGVVTLSLNGCKEDIIYQGRASFEPWAGYWWPYLESRGTHLYDDGGPMEKYDLFVIARGNPDPQSKTREKELWNRNPITRVNDGGHRTTDPTTDWFGHCHSWASASILEDEPTQSITKEGITFTVADLKGLITELHHRDGYDMFFGRRYDGPSDDIGDPPPSEFHKALTRVVGDMEEPLVMDLRPDAQVWNHPVWRYEMEYEADSSDPQKKHVTCAIWYELDNVDPGYIGNRSQKKKLHYYLLGNDLANPTGGGWEGQSVNDHPDFMWHPRRRMTSSNPSLLNDMFVNYSYVKEIYPALR